MGLELRRGFEKLAGARKVLGCTNGKLVFKAQGPNAKAWHVALLRRPRFMAAIATVGSKQLHDKA